MFTDEQFFSTLMLVLNVGFIVGFSAAAFRGWFPENSNPKY